jgi:glycosyltransferase involved in cell wall biosynthesis
MRRILHLVGASEDNGGILSYLRGIASHGPALGWEHVVWMRRGFQQVRWPRLEVREARFALGESPSHLRLLLSAACAWPSLRRLVKREGFDVVNGHSRGALLLSSWMVRSGRPTVFTNHAYARRTGMYRRIAGTPGLTTILLTPNQGRHYGIEPVPGRVETISACGADRYFEFPLAGRAVTSGGVLRVVGVGNVVRWKRWDLLLEALSVMPADLRRCIEATIWGPVPDEADARVFASELHRVMEARGLGGTVRFAGPTRDIEGVLAGADVFVLPSTNEPCSVALIEAMAMGVPAVVSASGGNVDIVRDGVTGLLFRPGSGEDLALKLEELMLGRARLASPEAVRASVAGRSARAVAAQHAAVCARVAGRG